MDYGAMHNFMHFEPTLLSSVHARGRADVL